MEQLSGNRHSKGEEAVMILDKTRLLVGELVCLVEVLQNEESKREHAKQDQASTAKATCLSQTSSKKRCN